jgi:hypothetical protein
VEIETATPDELIETAAQRAALYYVDARHLTPETAALAVSHAFGRIGAGYRVRPEHAHYVNVYVGAGIDDAVRTVLFPALAEAGHSCAVLDGAPPASDRAHGVMLGLSEAEGARFHAAGGGRIEMFAIGPTDRPVSAFGVSAPAAERASLEARAAELGVRTVWLTP